jgi:hypothetical protein
MPAGLSPRITEETGGDGGDGDAPGDSSPLEEAFLSSFIAGSSPPPPPPPSDSGSESEPSYLASPAAPPPAAWISSPGAIEEAADY